jgi:hypothetical protein
LAFYPTVNGKYTTDLISTHKNGERHQQMWRFQTTAKQEFDDQTWRDGNSTNKLWDGIHHPAVQTRISQVSHLSLGGFKEPLQEFT